MFDLHRYFFILAGTIFFYSTSKLLFFVLPSKIVDPRRIWKWKNSANSFIHSFITAVGSLGCFYHHPAMAEDLISNHTEGALRLVSFSVGYFIFDFYDMAMYHRKRSSFELMFHHLCVIMCFGLAVVSEQFVGYAIVALLVEVNSVFLHSRQLLIVSGEPRSCSLYRLTALFNVATFLVFRIAVLGWMTRWLVLHNEVLPVYAYTLGCVSLAIIIIMNIVLFIRICTVDFGNKKHAAASTTKNKPGLTEENKSTAATSLFFNKNPTLVTDMHLE